MSVTPFTEVQFSLLRRVPTVTVIDFELLRNRSEEFNLLIRIPHVEVGLRSRINKIKPFLKMGNNQK